MQHFWGHELARFFHKYPIAGCVDTDCGGAGIKQKARNPKIPGFKNLLAFAFNLSPSTRNTPSSAQRTISHFCPDWV